MTTDQIADEINRPFSNAFLSALVAAMSAATGSPWLVAAVPDAETTADGSEPVRISVRLEGTLQGELLLAFRGAEAAMLAAKCLRKPADAAGTEQSEVLLNLVEAGMVEFPSAVAEEFGKFSIKASLASEPAASLANVVETTAADDSGNRVSILMYLNPALSEALSLHCASVSAAGDSGKKTGAAAAKEGRVPLEQLNLELVLDVELNVTLRFGQRQLALREVLELTSGSVIELDRQVEEPVELLLEGKVIARGEAVVIDGNYGLRVTEVPHPIPSPVVR